MGTHLCLDDQFDTFDWSSNGLGDSTTDTSKGEIDQKIDDCVSVRHVGSGVKKRNKLSGVNFRAPGAHNFFS